MTIGTANVESTSAPGTQPSAYAALRNLVTGAFRRAGFANIARARRYYGSDDASRGTSKQERSTSWTPGRA